MRNDPYRHKIELTPTWQAVGGVLFLLAVAAPIAMIGLASGPDRGQLKSAALRSVTWLCRVSTRLTRL